MTKKVEKIRRYAYRYRPLLVDTLFSALSLSLAFEVRFSGDLREYLSSAWVYGIIIVALIRGAVNIGFGLYRQLWAYAGRKEAVLLCKATGTGSVIISCLVFLGLLPRLPRSVLLLDWLLYTALIGYYRLQYASDRAVPPENKGKPRRVLIVGAGECGAMLMREFSVHPEFKVLAFCDDDPLKRHQSILGVRVEGACREIPRIVQKFKIERIIIAFPSVERSRLLEVVSLAKKTGKEVKIVPALYQIASGGVSIRQLRDVKPEDLLGRNIVKSQDAQVIGEYINGKVVLVTGAGGSIGSELCRQITQFSPRELILLGRGENSIYEIATELAELAPELKLRTIIADVRQEKKMRAIFAECEPQIVCHAAAHKHVPLMEQNPDEAITCNVLGTMNVARAADEAGVERFIFVSTDKAVKPTSVMGASKRLAEVVIQHVSQKSKTKFMVVRFGNVLGSRGSVVPLFRKQIEAGGPVTVTDPRMTRYFMTISEAVMLVLHAGALGQGGEVFILDMGEPMRIEDLACQMIKAMGYEPETEIPICYTGIRPGEKLFEELHFDAESMVRTGHARIWSLLPQENLFSALENDFLELIKMAQEMRSGSELKTKLFALVKQVDVDSEEAYIQETIEQVAATN